MNAFTNWLQRRGPQLDERQLERLGRLPDASPLSEGPLVGERLVVIDLETSGFDLRRDQVLSIGAVVIEGNSIDLTQQFECTLRCAEHQPGASTLIHGLSPSAIAAGEEPAEALLDFMEFLGDSPLLAFHAGFDRAMLARALRQHLGYRLQHVFLDVAELAPLLCPQAHLPHAGLDNWTHYFGLQVEQRHHASADALATAEIALILFSRARRQGLDSLAALDRRLNTWRHRQHAPSL
ncbi:3'-5' exonuclease [Zestomonas carbonaria]|uniref:DNA polymerase III PolC-type n=1 Tax=Zestomonas carbonaria TaxID=2762745 RepID=A0A7U7EK89_9GAMM|nr:3'-5' exonuclease [Pseudomonas carbonaria]CAD5106583.1 DNA polymerase III PolC-type [Pseudomonas carbonaria]